MTDIKGKDATLQIRNPLLLNDYVFSMGGCWPLRQIYWRQVLVVYAVAVYLITKAWDLYDWLGNIDIMATNVLETAITVSVFICLVLLPSDKNLKKTIITMNQEIKETFLSENKPEKRLYQAYNSVSYIITKYGVITTSTLFLLLVLHPVISWIILQYGEIGNVTQFRVLPLRGHIFVDYSDFRVYCLIYACQCSMFYVAVFHTSQVALQITLVLDLCANLSILSYRIRKIGTELASDFKADIKKAVIRHRELIQRSYTLNEIFDGVLAVELTQSNIRLALSMYMIMINLRTDAASVCTYLVMLVVVFVILYSYSYAGEQLMYESTNVGEAFYGIDWTQITNEDRRTLLICLINGQKMLRVTAGKWYTFSRFGFTGLVKSAFAFVSMLQAMM